MPYRLLVRAAGRATGRLGWARASIGALLAVAFAAAVTHFPFPVSQPPWPWLVAPLGASAVLVFALPASPLAQPWPVFGGCMLSALAGLVAAWLVPNTGLACALAIALSIATMSLARCLHPPGGACALVGALGSPAVTVYGWWALLLPLGLNLAALLLVGWLYNNLTGHTWPHKLPSVPPSPPEGWLGSYEAEDLDAVLEDWDEVLDVSRDDLDALFRAVERRVQRRWLRQRG